MKSLRVSLLISCFISLAVSAANAGDRPITSFSAPYPEFGEIERLDPAVDELIGPGAKMEKLAEGFNWSEGPVWDHIAAKLYFSDVPENIAFQWSRGEGVSIYLSPSGFTGEVYGGYEPGSNGLAFDLDGHLVLCQHGDRRVARLNIGRRGYTTLASEYDGKRLNSPNDLVFDSKGNFFFTDPPYGMAPNTPKELEQNGIYKVAPDGEVTLLTGSFDRPNGIGLSPDEKTLYAAGRHQGDPIIMSYPVNDDGTIGEGTLFFDSTELSNQGRRGGNDGLAVDAKGNIWASGPGGVLILSPSGKHIGSLLTGRSTANCAFGGRDGRTLFITADDVLCQIRLDVKGYFPSR